MAATKNLYECDNVGAMLLHSLLVKKQPSTARKAAKELHVSGEHAYLWDVLTLAWLLNSPELPTEGLKRAAFLSGDAATFLEALCVVDGDLPPLPAARPLPAPSACGAAAAAAAAAATPTAAAPPWTRTPPGWSDDQCSTFFGAVSRALGRGDGWRAAFLVNGVLVNRGYIDSVTSLFEVLGVPAKFGELLQSIVFMPLCALVVEHALSACDVAAAQSKSVAFGDEAKGALRGARTLKIDGEALATWGVMPAPLSRIRGFPLLVAEETACAYWRDAMKKLGGRCGTDNIIFPDDDACEAFFSTEFPNDIPDEWSLVDQQKSHGIVLPSTATKSPWALALSTDCG
jgi:hypothetical protein